MFHTLLSALFVILTTLLHAQSSVCLDESFIDGSGLSCDDISGSICINGTNGNKACYYNNAAVTKAQPCGLALNANNQCNTNCRIIDLTDPEILDDNYDLVEESKYSVCELFDAFGEDPLGFTKNQVEFLSRTMKTSRNTKSKSNYVPPIGCCVPKLSLNISATLAKIDSANQLFLNDDAYKALGNDQEDYLFQLSTIKGLVAALVGDVFNDSRCYDPYFQRHDELITICNDCSDNYYFASTTPFGQINKPNVTCAQTCEGVSNATNIIGETNQKFACENAIKVNGEKCSWNYSTGKCGEYVPPNEHCTNLRYYYLDFEYYSFSAEDISKALKTCYECPSNKYFTHTRVVHVNNGKQTESLISACVSSCGEVLTDNDLKTVIAANEGVWEDLCDHASNGEYDWCSTGEIKCLSVSDRCSYDIYNRFDGYGFIPQEIDLAYSRCSQCTGTDYFIATYYTNAQGVDHIVSTCVANCAASLTNSILAPVHESYDGDISSGCWDAHRYSDGDECTFHPGLDYNYTIGECVSDLDICGGVYGYLTESTEVSVTAAYEKCNQCFASNTYFTYDTNEFDPQSSENLYVVHSACASSCSAILNEDSLNDVIASEGELFVCRNAVKKNGDYCYYSGGVVDEDERRTGGSCNTISIPENCFIDFYDPTVKAALNDECGKCTNIFAYEYVSASGGGYTYSSACVTSCESVLTQTSLGAGSCNEAVNKENGNYCQLIPGEQNICVSEIPSYCYSFEYYDGSLQKCITCPKTSYLGSYYNSNSGKKEVVCVSSCSYFNSTSITVGSALASVCNGAYTHDSEQKGCTWGGIYNEAVCKSDADMPKAAALPYSCVNYGGVSLQTCKVCAASTPTYYFTSYTDSSSKDVLSCVAKCTDLNSAAITNLSHLGSACSNAVQGSTGNVCLWNAGNDNLCQSVEDLPGQCQTITETAPLLTCLTCYKASSYLTHQTNGENEDYSCVEKCSSLSDNFVACANAIIGSTGKRCRYETVTKKKTTTNYCLGEDEKTPSGAFRFFPSAFATLCCAFLALINLF